MTDCVIGFPPIARPNARVLILGSAPSVLPLCAGHPHIRFVCFNGRMAQALWDRHVACRQRLPANPAFATLPSTSPANTRLTLEEKAEAWRASLLSGVT